MRLPWKKDKIDVSAKAAAACFGAALNYMQKPILGDLSKVEPHTFYMAAAEIVCFLFHMTDRTLFETVPHPVRQARMDSLLSAGIAVFAQEIRSSLNHSEQASQLAVELFLPLYDKRMDEYSSLGEDWLRLVLSKFGRHFCETLNGELSLEIYYDVQSEVVKMDRALMEVTPELFKP